KLNSGRAKLTLSPFMTKSIGAIKISRVVGSFSQTYMPRNFPSIVCARALITAKDPTTSAATLRSRLFHIEELHKDPAAPTHVNRQHPATSPGSGTITQRELKGTSLETRLLFPHLIQWFCKWSASCPATYFLCTMMRWVREMTGSRISQS